MSRFDADFATVLDAAAAVGNRRVLKTADPEGAARMRRKGRLLTDFSGNDYLGLSHHPLLKERAGEWAARWGAGSGASPLVHGTPPIHPKPTPPHPRHHCPPPFPPSTSHP